MKRVPESASERQIVHVATDTGDLQRFVISPENLDPDLIALIARMETEPIPGYRLACVRRDGAGLEFTVVRGADGVSLSRNAVHFDEWPPFLQLETTATRQPMSPTEAAILADLERCAAIALAGIDPR